MRKIMGIDLALRKSGVTVLNENGGLEEYLLIETDKNNNDYDEMIMVGNIIASAVRTFKVDVVCIESLSLGSISRSTRTLAMLYGYVVLTLRDKFGYEVIETPPTTLKKFFTGSGRAKKEDMFANLPKDIATIFSQNYKKTTGLYDMTDSYALAKYAINTLGSSDE